MDPPVNQAQRPCIPTTLHIYIERMEMDPLIN